MEQQFNEEYVDENSTIEYVKELESNIDNLTKEKEDLNNKYLYLLADFQNQKRIYENRISGLKETASSNMVKSMLPILDDLVRAIDPREVVDTCDKEGIQLIVKKFYSILQSSGISEINPSQYDTFDDNTMTAVSTIPMDIVEMKGKIAECIQVGFKYDNGPVIRHASVVVYI